MMVAVLAFYLAGYVVAVIVAARHWFDNFGAEFEGVAWAMCGALVWPLIVPPLLVWLVVRRFADV